jgi:hypothetical protein
VGAPFRHARHHRQHRRGAIQRLYPRLLVHTQHDRTFGRVVVEPDHVDDLVDEQRIGGQLEPVDPCGFRSNLRQIRPIVDSDRPLCLAIDARDQCVALTGVDSNVAVITASTRSSRIEGGRPGRGSSTRPSSRDCTNRRRHLFTVLDATPRSAATVVFSALGSAHASTIRERNANACDDFALRDQRNSVSRSTSDNSSSAFGRPVLGIQPGYYLTSEFPAGHTRTRNLPAPLQLHRPTVQLAVHQERP